MFCNIYPYSMISPKELIAKIKAYNPTVDEHLIQKAYIFSKTAHGNQRRHSGDPYFSHPLAVAEILISLKLDQSSIITALLHDVVEDTEITLEEIEKEFSEEVAKLVDGVTKLGRIEAIPSNETIAENFYKLTLAMSEDIRVLLVKLADRLHNMRTISYVPSREKRIRKARENLDIYAPLAARIGLTNIKDELEDISFGIIDPDSRNLILSKLNEIIEQKKDLIAKIFDDLKALFSSNGIECEISGRQKKPYSILQKMQKRNIGFYNINDIMAFRVIVGSLPECYAALGVVNSSYNMIPQSFKDYISTPKENGYRSLHLAILGPFNKKIEIQIRDKKMHEVAELGLAAHWNYKEKKASGKKDVEKYRWIRELVALFENTDNPSEVLINNKFNLNQDQVFCFTPNGDIFNLPFGSTAIDFAYAIHSEIGNSCISAKINGIMVPLRQKLENGDQVEIVTSKNGKPSSNWLQFAFTSKAKAAIKNFIRSEKHEEYSNLGKAILQKFFTARELEISDKILEKTLINFHKKTVADLYIKVAEGIISRQEVLKVVYPNFKEEVSKKTKVPKKKKEKDSYVMPIDGLVNGMAMSYAGCCHPIPGDGIVGIINTGTGVTIHNQTCYQLKNIAVAPQRILDVCWKIPDGSDDKTYSSKVRIMASNSSGSLADVTAIIAKKKININNIKIVSRLADYYEFNIDVDVKSLDHLEDLIAALRISNKVSEVERVVG